MARNAANGATRVGPNPLLYGRVDLRQSAGVANSRHYAVYRDGSILGCCDCAVLWVASGLTNRGYSLSHLACANV